MRFIAFFALLLSLVLPAQAAPLSADNAGLVKQAEDYMNALHMARARFMQTTPQGQKMPGTFYLNRPGKLRFEYDPPVHDFIVADGILIYFYDSQLGEQTNAPISQSLGDFILRKHLSLSGDLTVADVSGDDKTFSVTVVQTNDPNAGSLTLTFDRDPLLLKKWVVVDAQKLITSVELFDLDTNAQLPVGLFVYTKPKSGKAVYN